MQRAEMEELRQRDANLTALQAIGPRKKPRLDADGLSSATVHSKYANDSKHDVYQQIVIDISQRFLVFFFSRMF